MRPFVANGELWRVVQVNLGDPSLVDGKGIPRLAVTDPGARMIFISRATPPAMLDRVVLHEAAHALAMSYGLMQGTDEDERTAQFVEAHAMEAVAAAIRILGRRVCVRGFCGD